MCTMTSKCLKIWDSTKSNGKLISSCKLEELITKVRVKFETGSETELKLVLNDGCEVDEESFEALLPYTDLHFLKNEEILNVPSSSGQRQNMPSSTNSTDIIDLVQKIRQKKTSLQLSHSSMDRNPKRARRSSIKLNLGWLIQTVGNHRYTQVRMVSGGGTRLVEFDGDAGYEDVITKAKDVFFPDGESPRGKLKDFDCVLGDFKQNLIMSENFTVSGYVKRNCLTSKPRLYFMTKAKAEEDDWELPDLDIDQIIQASTDLPTVPDVTAIENVPSPETTEPITSPETTEPITSPETTEPITSPETTEPITSLETAAAVTSPETAAAVTSPETAAAVTSPETTEAVTILSENIGTENPIDLTSEPDEMTVIQSSFTSPVTLRMPQIPTCQICSDRYSDSFLNCGHILCLVCATELEERGSTCHICREKFSKVFKLFY